MFGRGQIPNKVIKLLSVGNEASVAGANLVPHRLAVPSRLSACPLQPSKSTFRPPLDKPVIRSERSPAHSETTLFTGFQDSGARDPHWIQCRPYSPSTLKCSRSALRRSKTHQMRCLQRKISKRSRSTFANFAGLPWNVPRRPEMIYGLSRSL